MTRILIIIAIISGIFISGIGIGYKLKGGNVAVKVVKQQKVEVKVHNEKVEIIKDYAGEISKLEKQLQKALKSVPRADVSGDCPIDELTGMRNEAIKQFNNTFHPDN